MILPLVISGAAVAAVAGAALVTWGVRGRRLDDHPCCRRCGYDLLGRDGAVQCPECGAGLEGSMARRQGRRRRRPGAIGAGAVLAALAAGAGTWLGVQVARGFDFNTIKPVWMLRSEAWGGSGPAITEFIVRLKAGTLAAQDLGVVVADALAIQQDRARAWDPTWGDLVEAAWLAKQATVEDWRTYRRHGVLVECRVRQRIRSGDPMPAIVRVSTRLASSTTLRSMASLQSPAWRTAPRSSSAPGAGRAYLLDLEPAPQPGRQTIPFAFRLGTTADSLMMGAEVESREEVVPVEIEVLGPDRDPIELVTGDELKRGILKAIRGPQCRVTPTVAGRRYIQAYVDIVDPPVDCAYRVLIREGGREWPLGVLLVRPGWREAGRLPYLDCLVDSLDVTAVDLVLRPDRGAAAETFDLWRICGEEIVIPAVAVELWEGPEPRRGRGDMGHSSFPKRK